MAAHKGALEPRLIERLRAELAELLAASVAYPAFFDFRANHLATRPIDRTRMDEIQQFVNSVNFGPIERTEVSATETRRFIERLIVRYIEVNDALHTPYAARALPRLRALAPRLAADIQRRALGYLSGAVPDFGARRQALSWSVTSRRERPRSAEERDRATRILEAALLQRSGALAQPSGPIERARNTPASVAPADPRARSPHDDTTPAPAAAFLASAPRENAWRLSEQPTGPLATPQQAADGHSPRTAMRELPPDLYQLYGDYLTDIAPAAPAPSTPLSPPAPASAPAARPASASQEQPPPSADARNDQHIFWQLRYQLEAYVRRAARSYGVPHQGIDPATVLDELRRSGFVDEADLRIAEGVFALTDRVTAQGHASEQEYRQALMLYLLYHRSHLNL